MSLMERLTPTMAHRADTDAGDSPLMFRMSEYMDSTGGVTGKYRTEVRLYNAGSALVKGQVYLVDYKGTPGTSPRAITPATNTPTREVVVAVEAVPANSWGWFCLGGWVDAMVEGTTAVAIGDYLKVTTGTSTTAFIKDSSTTYSVGTAAVAGAAQGSAGNTLTLVELIGGKSIIA